MWGKQPCFSTHALMQIRTSIAGFVQQVCNVASDASKLLVACTFACLAGPRAGVVDAAVVTDVDGAADVDATTQTTQTTHTTHRPHTPHTHHTQSTHNTQHTTHNTQQTAHTTPALMHNIERCVCMVVRVHVLTALGRTNPKSFDHLVSISVSRDVLVV